MALLDELRRLACVSEGGEPVTRQVAGQLNGKPRGPAHERRNGSTHATQATVSLMRTYEELDGAEGRAVFFRPHRFTAADLAPLRGTVEVSVGGARRPCALHDVSQNGVAFAWPPDEPVTQGQRLELTLRFDAPSAFASSSTS